MSLLSAGYDQGVDLKGMNTTSGEATLSKLILPPFWEEMYSKERSCSLWLGSKIFLLNIDPFLDRMRGARKQS